MCVRLLVGLVFLLLTWPTRAQDLLSRLRSSDSAEREQAADKAVSRADLSLISEELELYALDASARSTLVAAPPQLSIQAAHENNRAILRFALSNPKGKKKPLIGFELSSPFQKTTERTVVATWEALVGVPSAAVQLRWPSPAQEAKNLVTHALVAFANESAEARGAPNAVSASESDEEVRAALERMIAPSEGVSGQTLAPDISLRALASYVGNRGKRFSPSIALTGKGGRASYKFFRPDTLQEGSESHNNFAIGLTGGLKHVKTQGYLALTLRHERHFSDQKAANLCSPLENTPALRCVSRPFGSPARKDAEVMVLEWHQLIIPRLGVHPTIAHDLESNQTALSLPLYLIPTDSMSGDIKLNGGVALDWNSETDDVSLSIFIGAFDPR